VGEGEIAVALVTSGPSTQGEATLKRIYREGTRVRLQPANSTMEPFFVDPENLVIQGKLVSVIRSID
jgi:repressor LexA